MGAVANPRGVGGSRVVGGRVVLGRESPYAMGFAYCAGKRHVGSPWIFFLDWVFTPRGTLICHVCREKLRLSPKPAQTVWSKRPAVEAHRK